MARRFVLRSMQPFSRSKSKGKKRKIDRNLTNFIAQSVVAVFFPFLIFFLCILFFVFLKQFFFIISFFPTAEFGQSSFLLFLSFAQLPSRAEKEKKRLIYSIRNGTS